MISSDVLVNYSGFTQARKEFRTKTNSHERSFYEILSYQNRLSIEESSSGNKGV